MLVLLMLLCVLLELSEEVLVFQLDGAQLRTADLLLQSGEFAEAGLDLFVFGLDGGYLSCFGSFLHGILQQEEVTQLHWKGMKQQKIAVLLFSQSSQSKGFLMFGQKFQQNQSSFTCTLSLHKIRRYSVNQCASQFPLLPIFPLKFKPQSLCELPSKSKLQMQSRKGWSELEDDRLTKIIKKYGMKNWTLISQKLSLGGTQERTGKQCRERWHNNLNPAISNQVWSQRDDQLLFDAHRRHGSRWKEISKLFQGRTDNSIKNHFYSTVRCSLRRIGKMKGQRHTSASMKSIKPYVLSKIVENTQLTTLILTIGRDKSRNGDAFELDPAIVNHINSELQRISIQYEQRINKAGELKVSSNEGSSRSIESLSAEDKAGEDEAEESKSGVKKLSPEDEALKCYFEEQEYNEEQIEEMVFETQQESKERHEPSRDISFRSFEAECVKETIFPFEKDQKQAQRNDQIWIEQQECHNFFNSPSYRKRSKLPFLKLLSKISRNSQSQAGECEERPALGPRGALGRQQEEGMEIHYDPRDLLDSSFEGLAQKQCQ